MNIFDLLTEDEIADVADDNSVAFVQLVRAAQKRVKDRIRELSWEDEHDREEIQRAQYGFMTTMIGLGRSLEIAPFATMDVPRFDEFNYAVERQFSADLDHYMAQLVMGTALKGRSHAVGLSGGAKERIRTLIHHLKDAIDNAEMPEGKRELLHRKIAEFEAALGKPRLSLWAASRVMLEIMSISANVVGLADSTTFHKVIHNVMQVVAESKAAEDEQRQLPSPEAIPKAILPARAEARKPKRTTALEDFESGLDDIPF